MGKCAAADSRAPRLDSRSPNNWILACTPKSQILEPVVPLNGPAISGARRSRKLSNDFSCGLHVAARDRKLMRCLPFPLVRQLCRMATSSAGPLATAALVDSPVHHEYMGLALEEAELALQEREVPIGCVFIRHDTGTIVARGRNRTNLDYNVSAQLLREFGNHRHPDLHACPAVYIAPTMPGY